MQLKAPYWNVKLKWIIFFIALSSCVDRIDFDVPIAQKQLVIEGMISDAPGPYTVKISSALNLDSDSSVRIPVEHAKIKLYDDQGNVEDLVETSPGIYTTNAQIQGQVGHSYYINIETLEGKIFESEPEMLNPVGEVENIKYEFEARTKFEDFGEVKADVFNILVDANGGAGGENYVRWRFKGTYKVTNYPELHYTYNPPYTPYKNPFPCSGYILLPGPTGTGGTLKQVSDCTCCTCWVNQFENAPQLSDTQLIEGSQFKNVKIGEVPITNATFHDKYLVEVEQMSLTRNSFQFFKIIRDQKESASSLFQPALGEVRGNIKPKNNSDLVIGLFWATSIKKKSLFIYPGDVPYPLPPIDYLTLPCYDFYPNASAIKPPEWE